VNPKLLDALTFTLAPVTEHRMGCNFAWREALAFDGQARHAFVNPMFLKTTELIDFDCRVRASGCNFVFSHQCGQPLWFPTVQQEYREKWGWCHLEERDEGGFVWQLVSTLNLPCLQRYEGGFVWQLDSTLSLPSLLEEIVQNGLKSADTVHTL